MAKFIKITSTAGETNFVNTQYIVRLYVHGEWFPSDNDLHNVYVVDLAGAVDGLSCGARIRVSESEFNSLKSQLDVI